MFETEAVRENYELGVLAGEARERERIIKLQTDYCDANHLSPISICKCYPLIALIKGENK